MFDIKAEIQKYETLATEAESHDGISLLNKTLDVFQNNLKRFTKEQLGTNSHLEELIDMLQRQEDMLTTQVKSESELREQKSEKVGLVTAIIAIMDEMENIYRLTLKNNLESLSQFKFIWRKIINAVAKIGLTVLDPIEEQFDSTLCTVAGVISREDLPDGSIIEVLQSGYVYQGKMIRKAQVIVNKFDI